MIEIKFYKYLSDAHEIIAAEPGKTIEETFPSVNEWDKFKIIVNEQFTNEKFILSDGDRVTIRSIPYSGFKPKDWVFTFLTGGIYAFVKAGKDAYEASKAAKRTEEELARLKNQTKDDVANLPYIKGASNSIATGKTQPFLVGKNLMTPYILNASKSGSYSKGYHTIGGTLGKHQYLNRVYEMGFGPQVLDKIFMGNLLLAEFGQTEPKEEEEFHFTNKAFAGKDSFCEIRHGNRFTHNEFNKKIVEQEKNDLLKFKDDEDYQELMYTLEPNSMAADVCIMFNGLMQYTSSGLKAARTRHIIPSYSLDYAELAMEGRENEATWKPFSFDSGEIWHEPTTSVGIGYYRFSVNKKRGDAKPTREEILSNINKWTLYKGLDLRKNYNYFSYTCSSSTAIGSEWETWTVMIQLHLYVTTPGYWTRSVKTNEFTGNYSQQVRYNAHVDFAFNEVFEEYEDGDETKYRPKHSQPITIKVSTTDNKIPEGTDVSDCYIQWLHSYTYDNSRTRDEGNFVAEKIIEDDALFIQKEDGTRIPLSTLVGMKLEANEQNADMTDSIQIISSGVARVFEKDENGNYSLSAEKKMTSNPAAWWWEVQTSECHYPSIYEDEEMDLQTFGEWFDFCEENGFKVNFVITQGQTKSSILDQILNCGRGSTYTNIYGEIAVAWDSVKENASGLLNEQNLISFSYEKELSRKVDGVVCEYIDAENNYQQNTITVMYDGRINPETKDPETLLKKITANGMTTWREAYKYCLYVMKCDRFRKKKVSASMGKEGFFFTPLSKFLVQHPSLKIGLGNAEIKNVIVNGAGMISGLELYDAVTLSTDREYNIVIQCVSETYCTPKAFAIKGFDGRTKEIEFKVPFSTMSSVIPHAGDCLSYGYEVDTVTSEMLVTEIEENENGYALKLVDYDERIVNDDFIFPEYEPILTEPQNNSASVPGDIPSPTLAEVSRIVETAVDGIDLSFVESPNVYAELNGCGFSINDDGITPIAQKISTTVHVIQANKEIDFIFGDFVLPDGFSVDVDYHTLTFNVEKGVKVATGEIEIPIFYRPILHDNYYADEEGAIYCDEEGQPYGVTDFASEVTEYKLGFNYSGIKGGAYLGPYEDVEEITKTIVIGDYFTYTGEDTETFKKGGTYTWDGLEWVEDSVSSHMSGALSDVLALANVNLEQNNSRAYQFLDHLTANTIFADKIAANEALINKIVANEAFINNLFTKQLVVKDKGVIKSSNYNGTIDEEGNIVEYGSEGWAIAHDGKSDFVNLNTTNGNFEGVLNCGNLLVDKADVYNVMFEGDGSQTYKTITESVYLYLRNLMANKENMIVSVKNFTRNSWAYFDITLNSQKVEIVSLRYTIEMQSMTEIVYHFYGYTKTNQMYLIFDLYTSSAVSPSIYSIKSYYQYWWGINKKDALVLNIQNLPLEDPHIFGRAWLKNGALFISQG